MSDSLKALARTALANALTNLEWTEKFEKELTVYFRLDEEEQTSSTTSSQTTESGNNSQASLTTGIATVLTLLISLLNNI